MPLPPVDTALKSVHLIDNGPKLRIYTRPLVRSPRYPSNVQTETTNSSDKNTENNDSPTSMDTDSAQPSLFRMRSEHLEKGEYYKYDYRCDTLTVLVIGASGDLAKKKTYPQGRLPCLPSTNRDTSQITSTSSATQGQRSLMNNSDRRLDQPWPKCTQAMQKHPQMTAWSTLSSRVAFTAVENHMMTNSGFRRFVAWRECWTLWA